MSRVLRLLRQQPEQDNSAPGNAEGLGGAGAQQQQQQQQQPPQMQSPSLLGGAPLVQSAPCLLPSSCFRVMRDVQWLLMEHRPAAALGHIFLVLCIVVGADLAIKPANGLTMVVSRGPYTYRRLANDRFLSRNHLL